VTVIVGAGVVGLACALSLVRARRPVCVLERHGRTGLETSTHNSGVIHAGLYYPTGSLKAQLCVEGRERLYGFCRERGVPHVRCGKLIVAREDELGALETLLSRASANGATLLPVGAAFVRAREPHVAADFALWSPDTGWVEAEALVRALRAEVARHDGVVLEGSPVRGIQPGPSGGLTIATPYERIEAAAVVNAAGLWADDVAALAGGEPFRIHPCRGEYAELIPAACGLVQGLVYPVPDPSGQSLGTHLTKTLGGSVLVGPTIRFQDDKTDYERDRLPVDAFLAPARGIVPQLRLEDLRLGGSGIRPKLHPPTERFADFLIRRDSRQPALVHAAGIESPGLTACLAIGERVRGLVEEIL
jgi:L-2-hydroxyglutarate oxidase LhgO